MSKMCYANQANNCRVLKVKTCVGKECSFLKTRIQLKADVKRVNSRLASLDISKQNHIANKYHHGKYPWRKDGVGHNR